MPTKQQDTNTKALLNRELSKSAKEQNKNLIKWLREQLKNPKLTDNKFK